MKVNSMLIRLVVYHRCPVLDHCISVCPFCLATHLSSSKLLIPASLLLLWCSCGSQPSQTIGEAWTFRYICRLRSFVLEPDERRSICAKLRRTCNCRLRLRLTSQLVYACIGSSGDLAELHGCRYLFNSMAGRCLLRVVVSVLSCLHWSGGKDDEKGRRTRSIRFDQRPPRCIARASLSDGPCARQCLD